jgi:riboflavin kinase/FMN adenylyltransferase
MGLVFEVHLLDWAGDLYGQSVVVELIDFLRPEQRFASLEALRSQIAQDCDAARHRLRSPVTIAPCY